MSVSEQINRVSGVESSEDDDDGVKRLRLTLGVFRLSSLMSAAETTTRPRL